MPETNRLVRNGSWTWGGPEADLDRRTVIRETLAGVAALPGNQREALLRTAVGGDSRAQVAHDLGLTDKYRTTHQRFEVDGAEEARRFLSSHGIPEDAAPRVWTAIALHTTPGIPEFMAPEIALVTAGVETDVLGIGYQDLEPAEIQACQLDPDALSHRLGERAIGRARHQLQAATGYRKAIH